MIRKLLITKIIILAAQNKQRGCQFDMPGLKLWVGETDPRSQASNFWVRKTLVVVVYVGH